MNFSPAALIIKLSFPHVENDVATFITLATRALQSTYPVCTVCMKLHALTTLLYRLYSL